MDSHYSLIIIGGGLSGLAAGIRFARFGGTVLILEKHVIPGGLNSYYSRKGFLLETGLHAMTNFAAPAQKHAPLNRLFRQLKISRKKLGGNATIINGDMCDLSDIQTESAAAVLSFFAIHHINPTQILAAFKEWHRVLSKKGQLVIATWEGAGLIDYGDETDVIALRYRKDELTAWVIESGFSVDKCTVESVEEIPMNAVYLEATKK